MRKAIWIAIGFFLACLVGAYGNCTYWLAFLGALCIGLFLVACWLKNDTGRKLRVVVIGCVIGILCCAVNDGLYVKPVRELDGKEIVLNVTASDYGYDATYGTAVEGYITVKGRPYKVKLYLGQFTDLSPGDQLNGTFRMRYTGLGGLENPTFHRSEGIYLLGYARDDIEIAQEDAIPVLYTPAVVAHGINLQLNGVFPEDTAPFAQALLLGNDDNLSYEQDKALQLSGISHVIAVSGMHVTMLFLIIYSLCGKQRVLTAVIGIPVLLLFTLVAGSTPSIVRACVMQILMILSMVLNKEYDPPTALAVAVLVILGINPNTVASPGFQLSVGCMVGMFLCASSINAYLQKRLGIGKGKNLKNRLLRGTCASVSVTLGAMSITMPLCAVYFETISIVGILTNLITLPLITVIFVGVILCCLMGVVWLPFAKILAWILSWLIRLVLMIADILSRMPFASVFVGNIYILLWLVFVYILLMVFLKNKRHHPALFAICLALGLGAAVTFGLVEQNRDDFQVVVMDVGQGQCILLQTKEEKYLVDCGSDIGEQSADVAIRELLSRGIFSLDGVIVTHYDKDHAAGVNPLLSRMSVDTLYLPDIDPDNELRKQILAENEDVVSWVRQDQTISLTDGQLSLFPAVNLEDGNESSLCILFQPKNYDILITGDRGMEGEQELLETADLPQLELLVAGHHGSKNSTGLPLLQKTAPAMVVISVGEDNSYGHPAKQTLERLELFNCRVMRTDEEGTVTFRG